MKESALYFITDQEKAAIQFISDKKDDLVRYARHKQAKMLKRQGAKGGNAFSQGVKR